jgi:hypothetical protein
MSSPISDFPTSRFSVLYKYVFSEIAAHPLEYCVL